MSFEQQDDIFAQQPGPSKVTRGIQKAKAKNIGIFLKGSLVKMKHTSENRNSESKRHGTKDSENRIG